MAPVDHLAAHQRAKRIDQRFLVPLPLSGFPNRHGPPPHLPEDA
jgi:hypothetical protein